MSQKQQRPGGSVDRRNELDPLDFAAWTDRRRRMPDLERAAVLAVVSVLVMLAAFSALGTRVSGTFSDITSVLPSG